MVVKRAVQRAVLQIIHACLKVPCMIPIYCAHHLRADIRPAHVVSQGVNLAGVAPARAAALACMHYDRMGALHL
jgi:hypothetical protein